MLKRFWRFVRALASAIPDDEVLQRAQQTTLAQLSKEPRERLLLRKEQVGEKMNQALRLKAEWRRRNRNR